MLNQLLRPDDPWIWMALEVTGKATLLLIIAAILALALSRFSAALRHRMWAMVFAGLLMLPVASVLLPGLGLPLIPRDWNFASAKREKTVRVRQAAHDAEPPTGSFRSDPSRPVHDGPTGHFAKDGAAPDDLPEIATPVIQPVVGAVVSRRVAAQSNGQWLLLVWLAGAVSVLIPLVIGILGNLWLIRSGRLVADSQLRRLVNELSTDLAVRRQVTLLLLPEGQMPMTFGFVRSYVVLPTDACSWTDEQQRVVLLHELAHVKRHDVSWQMVARVACALYWFHPLVWWALRRMRMDREYACDDCVLATGQKASRYAKHLLEIARVHRTCSALTTAALSMARPSQLEGRLLAVLDVRRTRTPLDFARAAALLFSTVLAVMSLGALRLAVQAESVASASNSALLATSGNRSSVKPGETTKLVTTGVAGDNRPGPALVKAPQVDDDPITIRGTVVDSNGDPLEDATVRLAQPYQNRQSDYKEYKLVSETRSDKKGLFTFSYLRSQVTVATRRPEECVVVSGFKQGYGLDWDWRINISPREQSEIRLFINDLPITGRLVDLAGRPLAGVRVECRGVQRPHRDDLAPFIDAVKQGDSSAVAKYLQDPLSTVVTGLAPQLTDADGRFRLAGVGPERVAHLVFEGSSIAQASVYVVTRPLAPLVPTNAPSASKDAIALVGADFEIALPPRRAIEGVVRDAKTGAVLPNVGIQSWRFAGPYGSGIQPVRVVSDERGHFRLDGMPQGPGNRILAIPNDEQPYLMRALELPDKPGSEPAQVDVQLHRGIWISGRVTDQATGQPVPNMELFYLPFQSNAYARALPEFPPGNADKVDAYPHRYRTADDGTYRLVGLPGPAIVGLLDGMDAYCLGQGASGIRGETDENGDFLTYLNPMRPNKNWPTAMKEINPADKANSVAIDFALERGAQIEITSVDSARQPVSRLTVLGMTPDGRLDMTADSTFVASSFGPDEERTVLLYQDERGIGKALRLRADGQNKKLTVRLEPCAKVMGRIVDKDRVPVPRAEIRFGTLPADSGSRNLPIITSDLNGRFENSAVMIGVDYAVSAKGTQEGSVFHTLVEELSVEPGETIDLGTIELSADK